MPSVTLFFPAMLQFGPTDPDAFARLRLPSLELLFSRGTHVTVDCADEAAWLCRRFGVAPQSDWPVAPLSLAGEGIDGGDSFWLRADPVHLELQHERLLLWPPERLALTAEESGELAQALGNHFAAQNLHFLAPESRRWYVGVPGSPDIRTVSLTAATGHDVNRLLPQGGDRMRWHRMFNETQMLLHDHPVNLAREARGLPEANSLWFWGGGRLPTVSSPFDAVSSNGALARGLAQVAGVSFTPMEATGLRIPERGHAFAELSSAHAGEASAASPGDLNLLHQFEQRWFAPALEALRAGRLSAIELATVSAGRGHEWTLTRRKLRKFWKGPLSLADQVRRIVTSQPQ